MASDRAPLLQVIPDAGGGSSVHEHEPAVVGLPPSSPVPGTEGALPAASPSAWSGDPRLAAALARLPRLPILRVMREYSREMFFGDLAAGVIIAAMLVPQALSYSNLAGLPPVHGLYAAAFSLLLYPPFATSPHLSVGAPCKPTVLTAKRRTVCTIVICWRIFPLERALFRPSQTPARVFVWRVLVFCVCVCVCVCLCVYVFVCAYMFVCLWGVFLCVRVCVW
jgi:Sulfate permease family